MAHVNLKKIKGRNIELPIISILFSMHFLQLHNTYISVNSRAHPPQPLSSKCNKKSFQNIPTPISMEAEEKFFGSFLKRPIPLVLIFILL